MESHPVVVSSRLHVERSGSGAPLILAHGFGGSARNFRPQARAFSATRSVVLYDARGHARSQAPPESTAYTEQNLLGDFASIVASVGASPVVGGLSLGAYTALGWALAAEQPPAGLILAAFPAADAAQSRWALDFADAIAQVGLERAGERYVWGESSRFDAKAAAFIRQGFLEHASHALEAILRNVLSALLRPEELAEKVRGLAVPVLLIAGAEDDAAVAASERLVASLPKATLVIVPDAGHVVNLANPAAFNAAVRAFLEQLQPGPDA